MNLAKKSTVLLAALSVFAMTSCGPKEQKLDYDAAKEWVTKNYTSKEEKEVKQTRVQWDYSKTTGEDDTTIKMARKFVAGALQNFFGETFTTDDYANDILDKTVEGAHGVGNAEIPLNGENFDDAFLEDKDILAFAAKGKSLIVTYSGEEEASQIKLDRNDKKTYGETGYLQTWETTFDKKDVVIVEGGKKATLHLEIKLTPIF